MELKTIEINTSVGTIEDNLADVEESIRAKVNEYKGLVITEDGIKDGKDLVARLRKDKKELDDQRKAIKKAWMKPFDEFEKKAKAIVALYDEPIDAVNAQLSEYEVRRIEEKKILIQSVYDQEKGDFGDWIPLGRIYQKSWENKTTSEKSIRGDISLAFEQLNLNISTVRDLHSEFEADAMEVIKAGGTLPDALARITALKEQKARFVEEARIKAQKELEEKQRAEEEARKMKEASKIIIVPSGEEKEQEVGLPVEEEYKPFTDEEAPIPEHVFKHLEPEEEPFETEEAFELEQPLRKLIAHLTEEQLKQAKMFMDSIGAEYEVY